MIEEICVGTGLLVLLLILFYILFFSKPFVYKKKKRENTISLTVLAKRNLYKVTVIANDVTFERKRIRKDQYVEFDYPITSKPAKLIIEVTEGKPRTFEV